MRNSLVVFTLLSLCAEILPRPHGGGSFHRGGGGRSWSGHHHGYRYGYRPSRIGVGIGLGGVAVGLGYSGWRYGGWRSWGPGWWNTSPYWYAGSDWSSLSLERRLDAIDRQISILEREDEDGNPDAYDQLRYLRKRRTQLVRQL